MDIISYTLWDRKFNDIFLKNKKIAVYRAESDALCYVEKLHDYTLQSAVESLEKTHGILHRHGRTLYVSENPMSADEVPYKKYWHFASDFNDRVHQIKEIGEERINELCADHQVHLLMKNQPVLPEVEAEAAPDASEDSS